jgi:acetyl-CoA carboxylase biotin carboxyl carrier protein
VSLTAADVAEILRLLEQSSFDELNLEMNGVKLSLRRGNSVGAGARDAAGAGGAPRGIANATGVGGAAPGIGGPAGADAAGAANATRSPNAPAPPSAANPGAGQGAAPNPAATHAAPTRAISSDPNLHDVASPLLGTFYRSPKPGAPPFVEVGTPVTEDTIVAIIEVMKLMNTVRAGARGTVTEILPADGQLVEYDQPLLRIRKSG